MNQTIVIGGRPEEQQDAFLKNIMTSNSISEDGHQLIINLRWQICKDDRSSALEE